MLEVKTISVSIDRDWHDVYNAIWRPEAFQSWASGLAKSALENCDDHWKAHGPQGKCENSLHRPQPVWRHGPLRSAQQR
jgi:hypothetical protein